ncbi:MAG: tetratricopeptide repeat protein [Rubrivivax sp.]
MNAWNRCRVAALTALLAAGAWTAQPVAAQIPGELIKKGTGQRVTGNLSWRSGTKSYDVSGGGIQTTVPLDQVDSVRVAPPAGMEAAIKAVQQGASSGAPVATLEKVVDTYLMLDHDLTAMRWLGEAYLRSGNAKEAVRRFDLVMANRTTADLPAPTVRVYWNVLLAADRSSELRLQLGKAVEEGNRGVVAVAQVLRGDLDMKKQDFRSALVDGYLRTVVLFADVREVQPEALFKAAKCFEELRESQNAEKMRKKLLSEFPDSTYSKQINSGS